MSTNRKIDNKFGSTIKYLRDTKGISLKSLEEKTGISSSYINRLENGYKQCPSFPIVLKLAEGLDVDVIKFLEVVYEEKPKCKTIKSLSEVIQSNDFILADDFATREQKEKLIEIIEKIVYLDWDNDSTSALREIGKLIKEYKAIIY